MERIGAVILAGGASSRMGRDKARLTLAGETFLEQIAGELAGFDEVLLSVDRAGARAELGLSLVADRFPSCGPISGLYSALTACRSDWLLAVSCDIPLFSHKIADYLISSLREGDDAAVPVTGDGRLHPLCAVYSRRTADLLREQIMLGDYRMLHALGRMNVRRCPLMDSGLPDELLQNINTPEQYEHLLQGFAPSQALR